MVLRFNLLDGTAQLVGAPDTTPALEHLCRRTIVKSIGIQNLGKVNALPLPQRLKTEMGSITLGDFLIDGENLPPSSHDVKLYPATCVLTGDQVNLRIAQSAPQSLDDNVIATFKEDNQWIIVETQTKSLADLIYECKSKGTKLNERLIWRVLAKFISHLKENNTPPTAHLSTDSITFNGGTQKIQICLDSINDMQVDPTANATYEAPEVLNNANPEARAFVWSIGCIVYEALALTPAFYDPTGTNPFSVFQNILSGVVTPLPMSCNEGLRNLVTKCLVVNVDERLTFENLDQLVKAHSVA